MSRSSATRGRLPSILLFGASGQIGWELRRALARIGQVTTPDRAAAEFTNIPQLRLLVQAMRPSLVVNAAAYTCTDDAERERKLVQVVNAEAPTALAEESARLGVPFIHYSTSYVFDGHASGPYTELSPTGPLNAYGEAKLAGELGIRRVGGPHLILRTSWVYGARGKNFMRMIRRLARESPLLRVVADQRGTPTWSRAAAQATAEIATQMRSDAAFALDEAHWGLYHLTAAGDTTWYDFASLILRTDVAPEEHVYREIRPITTEEWVAPARRPLYSVLDNTRLKRTFGIALPHWQDHFALVMSEVAEREAHPTAR